MVKKYIYGFTEREVAIGKLVFGIIVILIGLMWGIRVINSYDFVISGLLPTFPFFFPLIYSFGLIIGGIVLIVHGVRKMKK